MTPAKLADLSPAQRLAVETYLRIAAAVAARRAPDRTDTEAMKAAA